MQVILKKDIPNVGRIGELVKVRGGYARNFLIPRSMAIAASAGSAKMLEHQKRLIEVHKKKVQKESQVVLENLKEVSISIERRANEGGKLFGGVTPAEMVELLIGKGYTVDKKDIEIPSIKTAGDYSVTVRLPGDVFGTVTLKVKAIQDTAPAASKAKTAKPKRSKKAADVAESETAVAEPTAENTPETAE